MDIQNVMQEAVRRHEAGELGRAEALYRQVLAAQPRASDALHLLGVMCIQREQFERAVEQIGSAIAVNPGNADYHSNLGVALRALGRHEDAARAFRRALELNPSHPNASYNLGVAERDLGHREAAIAAMHEAIAREPGSAERRCDLAGLLLEGGRFAEGLAATDQCLAMDPLNRLAISYRAVTLEQLGDREGSAYVKGLDRLVRPMPLPLPAGTADARSFCGELAQHVCNHPSLRAEPLGKATTNGRQTRELLDADDPLMVSLEGVLDEAVARYLDGLPADPAHPYLRRKPARWHYNVWGVVLEDQGHQAPHIHPSGWVSGVFYLRLPDVMSSGDGSHAGWIEFGAPPEEIPATAPPQVRLIAPEVGLMVLFPSYLHHRTVPFRSHQPRISIAFDACPLWDGG